MCTCKLAISDYKKPGRRQPLKNKKKTDITMSNEQSHPKFEKSTAFVGRIKEKFLSNYGM